jgi:hypothetical protein
LLLDRPQKVEAERRCVRITAGGDRINYPGDVSTKTSDLTTAKCLMNSVISTPGAKFMGIDLRISTSTIPTSPRIRPHPINIIPEESSSPTTCKYVRNGFVYFAIGRGMYGLPQAGRVANDALVKQLAVADTTQLDSPRTIQAHSPTPSCSPLS